MRKYLGIILFILMILFCRGANAQIIENKLNNKTYIYDRHRVKNKLNSPYSEYNTLGDGFDVERNEIVPTTVKKVLGLKRVKELEGKGMLLFFGCYPDGRVESVNFSFPDGICLTLEEIEKVESAFIELKFPVINYGRLTKKITFAYGGQL